MALKLLVNVVGIFSLDTCELLRVETLLFIHKIILEPYSMYPLEYSYEGPIAQTFYWPKNSAHKCHH